MIETVLNMRSDDIDGCWVMVYKIVLLLLCVCGSAQAMIHDSSQEYALSLDKAQDFCVRLNNQKRALNSRSYPLQPLSSKDADYLADHLDFLDKSADCLALRLRRKMHEVFLSYLAIKNRFGLQWVLFVEHLWLREPPSDELLGEKEDPAKAVFMTRVFEAISCQLSEDRTKWRGVPLDDLLFCRPNDGFRVALQFGGSMPKLLEKFEQSVHVFWEDKTFVGVLAKRFKCFYPSSMVDVTNLVGKKCPNSLANWAVALCQSCGTWWPRVDVPSREFSLFQRMLRNNQAVRAYCEAHLGRSISLLTNIYVPGSLCAVLHQEAMKADKDSGERALFDFAQYVFLQHAPVGLKRMEGQSVGISNLQEICIWHLFAIEGYSKEQGEPVDQILKKVFMTPIPHRWINFDRQSRNAIPESLHKNLVSDAALRTQYQEYQGLYFPSNKDVVSIFLALPEEGEKYARLYIQLIKFVPPGAVIPLCFFGESITKEIVHYYISTLYHNLWDARPKDSAMRQLGFSNEEIQAIKENEWYLPLRLAPDVMRTRSFMSALLGLIKRKTICKTTVDTSYERLTLMDIFLQLGVGRRKIFLQHWQALQAQVDAHMHALSITMDRQPYSRCIVDAMKHKMALASCPPSLPTAPGAQDVGGSLESVERMRWCRSFQNTIGMCAVATPRNEVRGARLMICHGKGGHAWTTSQHISEGELAGQPHDPAREDQRSDKVVIAARRAWTAPVPSVLLVMDNQDAPVGEPCVDGYSGAQLTSKFPADACAGSASGDGVGVSATDVTTTLTREADLSSDAALGAHGGDPADRYKLVSAALEGRDSLGCVNHLPPLDDVVDRPDKEECARNVPLLLALKDIFKAWEATGGTSEAMAYLAQQIFDLESMNDQQKSDILDDPGLAKMTVFYPEILPTDVFECMRRGDFNIQNTQACQVGGGDYQSAIQGFADRLVQWRGLCSHQGMDTRDLLTIDVKNLGAAEILSILDGVGFQTLQYQYPNIFNQAWAQRLRDIVNRYLSCS